MTRWVLGVDLGSSYSAGAVGVGDRVELLEVGGDRRVPSTVLLTEEGRLLAGPYAQRAVGRLPDRAERNPRRYVGRAPMLLGGEPVTAVDALAALLELFVHEARRRHEGTEPARVVAAHPVAWTQRQRAELREAVERVLPGTGVALLDEPVAAAAHYLHEDGRAGDERAGSIAVYDLGAGTFDTAVLSAGNEGLHVVGRPGGDPDIGGEAFDQRVYEHFGAQLERAAPQWWEQVRSNPERRWLAAAADLLVEARLAKEALSAYGTASQYVPGADVDVRLTRGELDDLIGDDVRRTAALLAETVEAAGGELRGVFLAGGASRTPLVEQTLRGAYDGLVRTRPAPEAVVALGAARWAGQRVPGIRPPRPGPAAPAVHPRVPAPGPPGPPLAPLAGSVLDARIAAGGVYTWSIPHGPGGRHLIARRDPATGRVERECAFDELLGWAVSDTGVVVSERRDGAVQCHALGRDLVVRSSTGVWSGPDPVVVAAGELAWVLLRSTGTPVTGPSDGSGRGEVGQLAVQVLRLGAAPGHPPAPSVPLGAAAYWYVDDDGGQGRLLDPAAPTTSLPAAFGDGRCALVIGRTAGGPRRPGRVRAEQRRGAPGPLLQSIGLLGPDGAFTPIVDQQARGPGTPWVHQLLGPVGDQPWLLATSVGLETFDDLRSGADRHLFLPRPPAGAVRWVRAGRRAYGLAVEQLQPGRGLSLHVLADGRRRQLGSWPALLGSPASVRATEAPRVRVDGEQVWVGAGDGAGGSHLVLGDGGGARVVASAPGWLEPVGRVGGVVLARHVPGSPPGDGCSRPGLLVRLTA